MINKRGGIAILCASINLGFALALHHWYSWVVFGFIIGILLSRWEETKDE